MAKLYGIGVGPGDPELMTLLAVRLIRQCGIIAVPRSGQEVNAAYTIARGACPEIEGKERLELEMPMTRDREKLEACHAAAAAQVVEKLKEGRDVAFLTLGDPSIYSTYIYVHDRVLAAGYEAQIVPGIPSFCAVAARLNEGLTEAHQGLHIIPASYKGLEEALSLSGTKVLMKSGKSIGKIREMIADMDPPQEVMMVERCGMEGERIFRSAEEIDENAGYFSLIVVKDKKN
ncbi:precorrin-2 C(20)-methyltransferase [Bacilliculturomica massiliensis]|uniref:precorrin-2 C(20)-methyltransferase n=1 Tax=Bacilliculturomica massiliensis TaxID=1917867 RepID=UPI0010316FAF|nr:precorrin-2 C(20)-methyltransferase [Bacilliculturomica massiliensis]